MCQDIKQKQARVQAYHYSFLDKLLIFGWFFGTPLLGLLFLIAAFIASQRPERYPMYPFVWVIPAGTFLLSLPILTVVILGAAKHIANRISRKKAEALERGQTTNGLIKNKNLLGTHELWKRKDFEREQEAKGSVKYKEKQISQEEKFAREQREKYRPKAVNNWVLTQEQANAIRRVMEEEKKKRKLQRDG